MSDDFDTSEEKISHGGQRLPSLRPRHPAVALWIGGGVANIIGISASGGFVVLIKFFSTTEWNSLFTFIGVVAAMSLVFIPFGMGIVAAYFWLKLPTAARQAWFWAGTTLLFGVAGLTLLKQIWSFAFEPLAFTPTGFSPTFLFLLWWPVMTWGVQTGLRRWCKFERAHSV